MPRTARHTRAPVSKERLYARALSIIDAEGLEALTMRRLAADLGVEAASLYHHVPNKQALLDGALGLVRAEMAFDEPLPQDWRDVLELVFMRHVQVLMAHPHLLPMAGRHVDTDEAGGLPYLVENGLNEEDAVALWQSIIAFVVGFAVFATESFPRDSDYLPDSLARRMAQWDEATCRRTVRYLLRAYAGPPTPPAAPTLPRPQPLPRPRPFPRKVRGCCYSARIAAPTDLSTWGIVRDASQRSGARRVWNSVSASQSRYSSCDQQRAVTRLS